MPIFILLSNLTAPDGQHRPQMRSLVRADRLAQLPLLHGTGLQVAQHRSDTALPHRVITQRVPLCSSRDDRLGVGTVLGSPAQSAQYPHPGGS
jgi:hypothetical protein